MAIAAVLTGDLIKSGNQPSEAVDLAMSQLGAAATEIAGWMRVTDLRFTRFRGDGWQAWLPEPWLALRAALVFLAALRSGGTGLSTRISVGIGAVDSLGTSNLSDAHGSAFLLSGRGLDGLGRIARVALTGDAISDRDRIIAKLMVERASRWTAPQAEAMMLYLHPDHPTLADLAKRLGISPQAVNYRLGGGGASELRTTLRLWEEVLEREIMQATK